MSALCTWCGTAYVPRNNGGKPQRFCSKDCRHDFFAACRAWAAREFEAGRVSVKDLQGASAQRARCYKGATAPFRPPDGLARQPERERASTALVTAHTPEAT